MYKSFSDCKKILSDIEAIDFHLAKQITKGNELNNNLLVFHLVLACSYALRQGHTCIDFSLLANQTLWQHEDQNQSEQNGGFQFPSEPELIKAVQTHFEKSKDLALVFDNNRLYLRRYWQFECELAEMLSIRIQKPMPIDVAQAKLVVSQLFNQSTISPDWQKISVANALNKSMVFITGGPGTGKTTTVTKLLSTLLMLDASLTKIAMAAPTGKAAQRLSESITHSGNSLLQGGLINKDVFSKLTSEPTTIHRLLGVKVNSPNFKHNQSNLLDIDLLLLDEVSMIDLPLMTRLFKALPPNCRVIMLGDEQQLPSVAAGSILADIAPEKENSFSADNVQYLAALTNENLSASNTACDYVSKLQHSFRFSSEGGIGTLAKTVIGGDYQHSWHLLNQNDDELSLTNEKPLTSWLQSVINQYCQLFKLKTLNEAFNFLNSVKVLTPLRNGPYGVTSINEFIVEQLRLKSLVPVGNQPYAGQPIMILNNEPKLQLFNGDIGIMWPDEGGIFAFFPTAKGEFKKYSPSRLPPFESVYAMTIHKTQGSEFDHVYLLLPDTDSPILSRELLYTGITRAKSKLDMFASQAIWHDAVSRKTARYSGLSERL